MFLVENVSKMKKRAHYISILAFNEKWILNFLK